MRKTNMALFGLATLGGYLAWRNRFALQRQLESLGIRTPLLKGTVTETARSIAAKTSGKMVHGATIAENLVNRTG